MINIEKTSFVGGEWSPRLYSRHDLDKYSTAVKKLVNFVPSPHGGVFNRAGTSHCAQAKVANKAVVLIPFQYNVESKYMLEFGDKYVRAFEDGVLTAVDIVTPYLAEDVSRLYAVQDANVLYIFHYKYPVRKLTRTPENVWSFEEVIYGANITAPTNFVRASGTGTGRTFCVTAVTELGEESLPSSTATGGVSDTFTWTAVTTAEHYNLYELKNGAYCYLSLARDTSFVIPINLVPDTEDSVPEYRNPYGNLAKAPNQLTTAEVAFLSPYTYDSVNNAVAFNAVSPGSGSAFELSYNTPLIVGDTYVFTFDAVISAGTTRMYYEWPQPGSGYLDVAASGSYITPEFVYSGVGIPHPIVFRAFSGATTGYVKNFKVYAVKRFPGCGIFKDQRLLYARTDKEPQTIKGSVIGSYNNLNVSKPLKEDDSFSYEINSTQVNEIRWLANLNDLIVGTAGAEWKMSGASSGGAISPLSVSIKLQSEDGCSYIKPITIGNILMFIENSNQGVRQLGYSAEGGGYTTSDLTIMANHLFKDYAIVSWCYQRRPYSIIWAVRDDGVLLGFTYYKEHEVSGWHQHTTDGLFEAVESIQSDEGFDDVYCVVNRNGVRQIERFVPRMPVANGSEGIVDIKDSNFLDSSVYSTASCTISGLTHLDGRLVTIVADGVKSTSTVSSGRVILPIAPTKARVGLPYEQEIETLDFVAQTQEGGIKGRVREVKSIVVEVGNTKSLMVGPTEATVTDAGILTNLLDNNVTALYTGDVEVMLDTTTAGRKSSVFIKNSEPFPVEIQSIIARVDYGEF